PSNPTWRSKPIPNKHIREEHKKWRILIRRMHISVTGIKSGRFLCFFVKHHEGEKPGGGGDARPFGITSPRSWCHADSVNSNERAIANCELAARSSMATNVLQAFFLAHDHHQDLAEHVFAAAVRAPVSE